MARSRAGAFCPAGAERGAGDPAGRRRARDHREGARQAGRGGLAQSARAVDRGAMIQTPADVMLFAAGLGTRMLPLTLSAPKPLIAVGGKPLIAHALEAAMSEGHRRFV